MSLGGYHHVSDLLMQVAQDPRPVSVLTHEFIQNVVFASFPQDNDLQIERLNLAVRLYSAIGFTRKAAFYQRFAALKYVSVHLKSPNWQECYNSLLDSLAGYGLTLDPIKYERSLAERDSSWPGIHLQLLEELITCCRKLQFDQLAIRHMSFILHSLDDYLPATKKRDLADKLDILSSRCGEDSPIELRLTNGFVMPQVNLTKFPLCIHFEPLPLAVPLRAFTLSCRPVKKSSISKQDEAQNPFIFTPFASRNQPIVTSGIDGVDHANFKWIQDETASTLVMFRNTLPFELHVSGLKLLADGRCPLETLPASLKLDPGTNELPVSVHLLGIPRFATVSDHKESTNDVEDDELEKSEQNIESSEQQTLKTCTDPSQSTTDDTTDVVSSQPSPSASVSPPTVTDKKSESQGLDKSNNKNRVELYGYSTHVLGVKSDCHLDLLAQFAPKRLRFSKRHTVDVLPAMARIELDIVDNSSEPLTESEPIEPTNAVEKITPTEEKQTDDTIDTDANSETINQTSSIEKIRVSDDEVKLSDHVTLVVNLRQPTDTTKLSLLLRNTSVNACIIEHLSMESINTTGGLSFEWSMSDLSQCVPLGPGVSCSLNLVVSLPSDATTNPTQLSGVLMFEYSGGDAFLLGYGRKAALKIVIER